MILLRTTNPPASLLIACLACLSGCGLPGHSSGSTSTPAPANPTQGLIEFKSVSGPTGPANHSWSTTGRILNFAAGITFPSVRTGDIAIPWEIHSGTVTGPLVTSGSAVASDSGVSPHVAFQTPVLHVDLHTAPPGGTTIFIVLDPNKTLVTPEFQAAAYDSYRIEQTMVPTSL